MKKQRSSYVLLGVFVVLVALVSVIYYAARPAVTQGEKTITVAVIHQDASVKSFSYRTSAEYLEEVLLAEELIQVEQGPYGSYIVAVDGESAVFATDGAYWALYRGETYSNTGISETPVVDGETFSLVYTVG